MRFGPKQLKNPTPSDIIFWVRFYTVGVGILMTALGTAPFSIPHEAGVNWLLTLSITLANGLSPLFGVKIDTKTVPTEMVSSIDEKTKP